MPISTERIDRISHRIEWAFVVLMSVLFIQALLTLFGLVGDGDPFQPRRFAVLTGSMLLQPVAALVMRRSRAVGYSLVALSMAGLAAAFVMGS